MTKNRLFPGKSGLLTGILLCLWLPGMLVSAQSTLIGDVNGSGSIDIIDALMTAQYYVGLNPPNFNAALADVDGKGSVNIIDALMIAQYYVGLIDTFPAGQPTDTPVSATATPISGTPTPAAGNLILQYRAQETASSASQIRAHFNILNKGSLAVALSELAIRYYYTKEGSSTETSQIDYAVMGSTNVNIQLYNGYFEVTFTGGAGNVAAGASSGEVQTRVNKTDWTVYTQLNDYSFDGTKVDFINWERVTLYRSGQLVWGIPGDPNWTPNAGTPSPTPGPHVTPVATATPIPTDPPTAGGIVPTPGSTTTNSLGAAAIRLNQAGYRPGDNYKTAVVAGLSGAFQLVEQGTNILWYSGTLTSLGSDSGTGESLTLADFSAFGRPGTYYLKVGNQGSPSFDIKNDLYNQMLYYTTRIYGANRCGAYDSWIHSACHTLDGSIRGAAGSLTGGWHDCGDHVKFGGTMGYAAAMLLFTYNAWPDRFGDVYRMNYDGTYSSPNPDGIPDVVNEVKVVTDYFLNLYDASLADGLINKNKFYYQVGDGDEDHSWWNLPQHQDSFGQGKGGAPREIWDDIASDLAGRFSATLSLMALAYKPYDAAYAARCVTAARALYDIGRNVYGKSGDTGGKGYYSMDGRSDDDMALAGVELYRVTGEDYYLNKTTGAQYYMMIENKWQFVSYYVLSFPNMFSLVLYDYYPFASTLDNGPSDVDTLVVTKDECIQWLKLDVTSSSISDPYGRAWQYGWGTARYMMGLAATAVMAYDLDRSATDMLKIAKDQMNWVLGRNQFGMSFVVGNKADGWLTRYPQHPHHRAANPDGANVPELGAYPATELTGATIGGPSGHTKFSDEWDDYTSTETGIDYWAGTFLTSAYFAEPVK